MVEFRCKKCGKLLAMVEGNARVQTKCQRCHTLTEYPKDTIINKENAIESVKKPEKAD